jgi:hypothetical protein
MESRSLKDVERKARVIRFVGRRRWSIMGIASLFCTLKSKGYK